VQGDNFHPGLRRSQLASQSFFLGREFLGSESPFENALNG